MRDLVVDLRAARRRLDSSSQSRARAGIVPARSRTRYVIGAVFALALVSIVGGVVYYSTRGSATVSSPLEYVQITNFTDAAMAPSFSPDGRMVAFKRGTNTGQAGAVDVAAAALLAPQRVPVPQPQVLAVRQPAHLHRSAPRVRLSRSEWARLARLRRTHGITCAAMAQLLGYRQACSVSEFETCRSMPPEPVFRDYLAALAEHWPPTAELLPSHVERWSDVLERCLPDADDDMILTAVYSTIGALNSVDGWPKAIKDDVHVERLVDMVVGAVRALEPEAARSAA